MSQYLQLTQSPWSHHPPITDLPMLPHSLPYYRGPRLHIPDRAWPLQDFATDDPKMPSLPVGCTFLAHILVQFGSFPHSPASATHSRDQRRILYNAHITSAGWNACHFSCVVYTFNNGHFLSSILTDALPFSVAVACDPHPYYY